MAFQQRLVNKEVLRNLVEQGGVQYKQNARSWILCCPLCSKQKLYVEKTSGRSKCMHCGSEMSGWADYILSRVYPHTREELGQWLYGKTESGILEKYNIDLNDFWGEFDTGEEITIATTSLPPEIIPDPDFVDLTHPAGAKGAEYLNKRGISLPLAQKYGIQYNPREKRVVFPVIVSGVLRGWQSRLIIPNESYTEEGERVFFPKIMTTGRIGGRVLMFQDNLKNSNHGIMVEGPIDAIKCDLCGGNTATMGKSYTDEQMSIYLKSGIKRLYVGLDDDATDRIMKVARDMYSYLELYRLATPPGREDLGDSTLEEVYEQFKSAVQLNPAQVFVYLNH